jgi:hypothetical protein
MMEKRRITLDIVTEHSGRICSDRCALIGRGSLPGELFCDAFGRLTRDKESNLPLRVRECFATERAMDEAIERAKR